MITLKNNRLAVTAAEPNLENITYRFDRAAFVTSVVLDGKYEFCSEEGGGSWGVGLCSEIQCDPLSKNTPAGGQFVKFGVGLLTKEADQPYAFLKKYDCADFEVKTEAKEDSVVFTTAPRAIEGYALAEKKTVSLHENSLKVEYEFTNAGEKDIEFREYVHNFVAPNRHPMDGTYNLFTYNYGDSFEWKLWNKEEGLTLREVDDFHADYTNFWTNIQAICPEIFYHAVLKPGETAKWSRTWYFETGEDL